MKVLVFAVALTAFVAQANAEVTAINAWASSEYKDPTKWGAKFAWKGDSKTSNQFFHSKTEDNPWLKIQLNKATSIGALTIINRKDCCGERLANVEVRAGMKNDLTNEVVGTFAGPGTTGGSHVITFKKPVVAEFITIQVKKKASILQVNGLRVKEEVEWTEQIGYCRDCDGKDQNKGAISSSVTGKAACLEKCRKNPKALACEIHVATNWCTIYTEKVAQGFPQDKTHICWAPPKAIECLKPELRLANPPTEPPPAPKKSGCVDVDTNYVDHDLPGKQITGVKTWQECAKHCADTPACATFTYATSTWHNAAVRQKCFLKGDGKLKKQAGKTGLMSGPALAKDCPVPKTEGCIDVDYDYAAKDIPGGGKRDGVKTWQECAKICADTPKCARFTYATSTFSYAPVRNTCFMKADGEFKKKAGKKGLISGPALAKECSVDYSFEKNKDNTECSNYSAQACHSEKNSFTRHDKKLLLYWRYDITWENIRAFTKSMVCTCAKAAKAAGKTHYAIHFWGECWAINMDDFRKNTGGDCRRDFDKKCNGNDKRMCFADKDFQVYKTA